MPLYVSLVFKGTKSHVFALVVALQTCSCMLSYPVHLDPPPPQRLATCGRPGFSSFLCIPIQHPSSRCLVLFSLCVMCSAQLCVCAMYIVWTPLSAPPFLHFSHLHCVSLRPGFSFFPALLSVIKHVPDFSSKPPNSYCAEQSMADFTLTYVS